MSELGNSAGADALQSGALAIFVKTPGLSSIKTRLAKNLGTVDAARFYELAIAAIETVARAARDLISAPGAPGLTPYWAIAEAEGISSPYWSAFSQILQGEGGLGTRLHNVYSQLLPQHSFVLLVGADSPQMPLEILVSATQSFLAQKCEQATEFLLGRTDDGGYYLFGGNQPIPRETWESVPYSASTTAEEFARRLAPQGKIKELPKLFDVDTLEDLIRLSQLDDSEADLLEAQRRVIAWARDAVRQRPVV